MSMRNNNTPLISVIIPVWNPGPGITRCIESLRNQTLKEIEMIFVDDCGTDDSMDKVRAALAEDSRIRIIYNEENHGAGPSRNKGIEVARGEYLSFVDADDYVAPSFFELLYEEAQKQKLDIVKGSIVREMSDGSFVERGEETNLKIIRNIYAGVPLFCAFRYEHQSAIYRRELINSSKVRYGASKRGEDSTFLLQVCSHAQSFSTVDKAYYYYCQQLNGITHTINACILSAMIQSLREQVDYALSKMSQDHWVQKYMEKRFLYILKELGRFCDNPIFETDLSDKHNYLLPPQPFVSWKSDDLPMRYVKLVERWIDFYLDLSKEKDHCWKELRKLIISASDAVNGKPPSSYTKEAQRQGRTLLYHQITRLPLNLRLQIGMLTVKRKVKRIVSGILGKLLVCEII